MKDKTDAGGRMTVLIVEDQALLRQSLHSFLQDAFPDRNFLAVADGASALEVCNAHRPQLVLMDICLPDANGIELTARLVTLYSGIRVIVVSHHSAEVYVQHALAAGALAYVCKDDIYPELVPVVAAALGIPPVADRRTS